MTKSKSKNFYDDYYLHQVGQGLPVYSGERIQRGHGLGSIFGSMFRRAVPLLKKGARTLAAKGIKAGARAAVDMIRGRRKPKEAVKSRMIEAGMELMREQKKTTTPRKKAAPKKKATPRKKTTPKKTTRAMYARRIPKDIFQ